MAKQQSSAGKGKGKKYLIMLIITVVLSTVIGLMSHSFWVQNYGEANYNVGSSYGNDKGGKIGGMKPPVNTSKQVEEPSALGNLFGAFTQDFGQFKLTTSRGDFNFGVFFTTFLIIMGLSWVTIVLVMADKASKEASRVGHEHGKQRIGTDADLKTFSDKYTDPNGDNVLFAQGVALSMDNKATNRVSNTLVIGGTGTGKTFRYIKPNIAQFNCSRVITDPSGDIFRDFAPSLIENGKNVYLFNIKDFELSNHYNPLLNVYDAEGNIDPQKVDILVDLYMENANNGQEQGGSDPFWPKSEKAFITGVMYYVLENDDISKEDKCFHTVLEKVQLARADGNVKGDNETKLTKEIKEWQSRMEMEGRHIMTPLYYDTFLIAPEKTANTILITTAVDLQLFSNPKVDRITRWNVRYPDLNIDLDELAKTESYLFLSIPQDNKAFNFLIAMIYSQLFSRLYVLGESILVHKWCLCKHRGLPVVNPFDTKEEAEEFKKGVTKDDIVELPYINGTSISYLVWNNSIVKKSLSKKSLENLVDDIRNKDYPILDTNSYWGPPALPMRVEFMLDEFKNIGKIPNFDVVIATCRKYRIGVHVVIQDIAQLKELYPQEAHQTILANVDTILFLGSPLQEDIKYIQEKLGKTTIRQRSTSGSKTGNSISYTPTEVDLMSMDEIKAINGKDKNGKERNDAIVMIRDICPFVRPKLSFLDHPNFKLLKSSNINANLYFENNKEDKLFG